MSVSPKTQQLLASIQEIAKVHDTEVTAKKLDKILKDGFINLHIICDFDRTMTTYYKNKDKKEFSPVSHSVISRSSRITNEYKQEMKELFEKYYPIETDTGLTLEQKIPYMVEWWENAHESLKNEHINKDDIDLMVAETPLDIREGLKEFLDKCKEKNMPFLVFSAGLKNVIKQVLIARNLYHEENMHVVSNEMTFDPDTGICNGFTEPLIHVFNKSEVAIKDSPYHKTIEDRKNVILLGDSLGDLQMSRGIEHDICLNLGFLNYKIDDLLNSYLKEFDIVILDDGPMDVANMIMEAIDNYM